MIKTRLVRLLSHAKKYIVYNILWQWIALLAQILAVFSIAELLGKVVDAENLPQALGELSLERQFSSLFWLWQSGFSVSGWRPGLLMKPA